MEARLVLPRHPEQPTDHGHGKGVRELVDHIDPVSIPEAGNQVRDDPGEFVMHRVDTSGAVRWAERTVGHPTQPVVFRRVEPQEAGRQSRLLLLLGQLVTAARGEIGGV